jgi:hypothetical protein
VALGQTQPPTQSVTRVNRPGLETNHLPPSSWSVVCFSKGSFDSVVFGYGHGLIPECFASSIRHVLGFIAK